jgi:hypothetical protein
MCHSNFSYVGTTIHSKLHITTREQILKDQTTRLAQALRTPARRGTILMHMQDYEIKMTYVMYISLEAESIENAIESAKQTAEEQHGNRISEFAEFKIKGEKDE